MAGKQINLDELCDDPLELTIGGVVYKIESLTVDFAIRLGNATENPPAGGPLALLLEVLTPLGADEATILAMDSRKALAAAFVITSHFTQLPETVLALSPTPAATMAAQRLLQSHGLQQS